MLKLMILNSVVGPRYKGERTIILKLDFLKGI